MTRKEMKRWLNAPDDDSISRLKAFNGDYHIFKHVIEMAYKYNIYTFIETGTAGGDTTLAMSDFFDKIVTIEADINTYNNARNNVLNNCKNVTCINASSGDVLLGILNKVNLNVMIFLDAHGNVQTPILKELEAIKLSGLKPFLFIHDFSNPAGFGFDTYNNQAYTYDWVKPHLDAIGTYKHYFNEVATAIKRGVIYVDYIMQY